MLDDQKNNKNITSENLKTFISNSNTIITTGMITENFKINYEEASNYLRELEKNGYITKKGKSEYINYTQSELKPELDSELKSINEMIKEKSPFMEFVIWSFFNLKNFYSNIPMKDYIFIEAKENFILETIRATLIEQDIESVVNPKKMDITDFQYRNKVPIILFKKESTVGTIKIDDIVTPTIEKTIVDLYYYITRRKLPFSIEELGKVLKQSIKTGVFNFTFVDNYIRRRNLEFDFLMSFSFLEQKFPNLIPNRYRKRLDTINNNVKSFVGEL